MRAYRLAIVSLMALASATTTAFAEEPSTNTAGASGVSFVDAAVTRPRLQLSLAPEAARRFEPALTERSDREDSANRDTNRRYELQVGASRPAGLPLDVAVAQRASFGVDSAGDIARHGRGSELRLGRGINMRRQKTTAWNERAFYMFIASDDEAITWSPGGARSSRGGGEFALQDRVEIGDIQAGVTYEFGGLQASLAYVEREVSTHAGARSFSHDENFAGLTITMRR